MIEYARGGAVELELYGHSFICYFSELLNSHQPYFDACLERLKISSKSICGRHTEKVATVTLLRMRAEG